VKNLKTNFKPAIEWAKTATILLVVGFAAGAFVADAYDTQTDKQTEAAIQAALKSIPTAEAATPKSKPGSSTD
jgi:predicted RND superfamily exporter protein